MEISDKTYLDEYHKCSKKIMYYQSKNDDKIREKIITLIQYIEEKDKKNILDTKLLLEYLNYIDNI